MARINVGTIEFDLQSTPASTTTDAAYNAWAAELDLPSSGTLQALDADDAAFVLSLARSALGVSPVACFARKRKKCIFNNLPYLFF